MGAERTSGDLLEDVRPVVWGKPASPEHGVDGRSGFRPQHVEAGRRNLGKTHVLGPSSGRGTTVVLDWGQIMTKYVVMLCVAILVIVGVGLLESGPAVSL